MKYKIISDSCLDPREGVKPDCNFKAVPLTLYVDDDYSTIDDESFDQKDFIARIEKSATGGKSACPSPQAFKDELEGDFDYYFIITLSKHLSGSYQSAELAKNLYIEENPDTKKKILVINSKSASAGQLNIALKLYELCEAGLDFDKISEEIIAYTDTMQTYFVIESLEPLRKNGRLSGLTAIIATALNIKPVMGAVDGKIIKKDQCRGIKKALERMVDIASKECVDPANARVVISQCNNPVRGKLVAEMFRAKNIFKDVIVTKTAGVATLYAGDGGIVVAVG